MSPRLVVCTHCGRHVRLAELACPFCKTTFTRSAGVGTGVVVASVVAVALAGCGPGPAAVYGPPPQTTVEATEPPAEEPIEQPAEEPGESEVTPAPLPETETPPDENIPEPVVMYGPPPTGRR